MLLRMSPPPSPPLLLLRAVMLVDGARRHESRPGCTRRHGTGDSVSTPALVISNAQRILKNRFSCGEPSDLLTLRMWRVSEASTSFSLELCVVSLPRSALQQFGLQLHQGKGLRYLYLAV